jgi:hypothetical protein
VALPPGGPRGGPARGRGVRRLAGVPAPAQARLLRDALAETAALDPHWRLDDLEFQRATVPDAENSAAVIRHARALLPVPGPDFSPELADLFSNPPKPEVRLTDAQYRAVIDALEETERAINPALKLADYPRGRHPITYAPDGVSTVLRHVDDMITVGGRVLRYLPLAHAHEGNGAAAERDCLAVLNLGRSLGDEPLPGSQFFRARFHRDTLSALERFLGQTEVPEPALAVLQRELAAEAEDDPWELFTRGERAVLYQATEAVRTGTLKLSFLRGMFSARRKPAPSATELVREWLDDRYPVTIRVTQARLLRLGNRYQETARLPWPKRRAAVAAVAADQASAPDPVPALSHNMAYAFATFQGDRARAGCMVAAAAAERHRLRHGTWPDSLAALVPEFLPAVPADPFDGRPRRYRRLADGVVIYAVGPGGADDGGVLSDFVTPPTAAGTDVGVRLWDPARRRQPPTCEPPGD